MSRTRSFVHKHTARLSMNTTSPALALIACSLAVNTYAGDIIGRVTLKGTPPPERSVDLKFHRALAAKYPNGLHTRHYQVSPDSGLRHVLVYVRGSFDAPTAPFAPLPRRQKPIQVSRSRLRRGRLRCHALLPNPRLRCGSSATCIPGTTRPGQSRQRRGEQTRRRAAASRSTECPVAITIWQSSIQRAARAPSQSL
jgi:hypothetical protein